MPTTLRPAAEPQPAKSNAHADYLAALALFERDDVFIDLMLDIRANPHNTRH
jgi:hypothetical protein